MVTYREMRKLCLRIRNLLGLIDCEKCRKQYCFMKRGEVDGCGETFERR